MFAVHATSTHPQNTTGVGGCEGRGVLTGADQLGFSPRLGLDLVHLGLLNEHGYTARYGLCVDDLLTRGSGYVSYGSASGWDGVLRVVLRCGLHPTPAESEPEEY